MLTSTSLLLSFDALSSRFHSQMIAQGSAALTAWTASSRLFFALARDDAFPYKKLFMAKNRNDVPWAGVVLSCFIGCAICACYIGSTVAFGAILSAAAISVLLA